MDHEELTCSNCDLKEQIELGNLKIPYLKTGLAKKEFFCEKTHHFVNYWTVGDPKIYAQAKELPQGLFIAEETKSSVEPQSKFHLYSVPECPNALVPLGFYLSEKGSRCPICEKGKLRRKITKISD